MRRAALAIALLAGACQPGSTDQPPAPPPPVLVAHVLPLMHVRAIADCPNENEDADEFTPSTIDQSRTYTVIGTYGLPWPQKQDGVILLPDPPDVAKWGRGPSTVWVLWDCVKEAKP